MSKKINVMNENQVNNLAAAREVLVLIGGALGRLETLLADDADDWGRALSWVVNQVGTHMGKCELKAKEQAKRVNQALTEGNAAAVETAAKISVGRTVKAITKQVAKETEKAAKEKAAAEKVVTDKAPETEAKAQAARDRMKAAREARAAKLAAKKAAEKAEAERQAQAAEAARKAAEIAAAEQAKAKAAKKAEAQAKRAKGASVKVKAKQAAVTEAPVQAPEKAATKKTETKKAKTVTVQARKFGGVEQATSLANVTAAIKRGVKVKEFTEKCLLMDAPMELHDIMLSQFRLKWYSLGKAWLLPKSRAAQVLAELGVKSKLVTA